MQNDSILQDLQKTGLFMMEKTSLGEQQGILVQNVKMAI